MEVMRSFSDGNRVRRRILRSKDVARKRVRETRAELGANGTQHRIEHRSEENGARRDDPPPSRGQRPSLRILPLSPHASNDPTPDPKTDSPERTKTSKPGARMVDFVYTI
ncbi:hypothetical protein CYLTODRAFT_495156 [Cylindrobasidium torrendii FP15055 ss-10]|uniref:Uncharacterized protein n=1 Tax=Cylindrobasidium torrendii FP15055 ss-10 TaxID=1314674 RepID=A0A0D7AWF8_9AGAR|nr:hypothetical protein CYLTODRAFT_495156 [Cylindrobasidium torrendii FP15055 ss-10]